MINTKAMVLCDGVGRNELEARLRAAAKEIDELHEHVTHLQTRGTELLDEARANRRIANAPPGELVALSHASHERRLQDARFGPIESHMDVPFADPRDGTLHRRTLSDLRIGVAGHQAETGRETCCWAHVVLEEAFELVSEPESEPKRILAEAVQLSAVCLKMIEILDRRANSNPIPVTGGIPLPGWTCMATRTVTDEESARVETCRAFNGANPTWRATCRSCDSPGPAEPKPVATPARLDADKTATGKTVLTARVRPGGAGTTTFVPPGEFHVDTETGKRTPLGQEPK